MSEHSSHLSRRFWTDAAIPAFFGFVGLVGGAVITAYPGFLNKNRELNIRLVEVGLSILRADPKKEDISPARAWAIEVIQRNSGVSFSKEDRDALLHNKISTSAVYDLGGGYSTGYDSDGRNKDLPRYDLGGGYKSAPNEQKSPNQSKE